eukprot:1176153-Prorocentrum_minimum.AAC.5
MPRGQDLMHYPNHIQNQTAPVPVAVQVVPRAPVQLRGKFEHGPVKSHRILTEFIKMHFVGWSNTRLRKWHRVPGANR